MKLAPLSYRARGSRRVEDDTPSYVVFVMAAIVTAVNVQILSRSDWHDYSLVVSFVFPIPCATFILICVQELRRTFSVMRLLSLLATSIATGTTFLIWRIAFNAATGMAR